MKRSVSSHCESHRYSCCSCGFSPLPAFMIEGDATFHSDVSEDEHVFFLMQICGALDSTCGSCGGPGTQTKSQHSPETGSCGAHWSRLPFSSFCPLHSGNTEHLIFKHIQFSPPQDFCLSLWNLTSGLCIVLLSCCQLKNHLL